MLPTAAGVTLARVAVGQASSGPCVVWGGYGYGNAGDDLVLAVALADLRREHGEHLLILSPAPDQTRSCFPDLPVVLHPSGRPRSAWARWGCRLAGSAEARGLKRLADRLHRIVLKHPGWAAADRSWLTALASASRLHLTGGGYLTDRFHLQHFLRPLRLARSRGLRVTTSPLGLGPFRRPENATAVANLLRPAKVAVRDEDSLRYCAAHGIAAVEKPDDGFRWREVVTLPAGQPGPSGPETIGICIYPQHSSQWSAQVEAWWVSCLQALRHAMPGSRLSGFCFHTGREMDYETTRRLFGQAGLNPDNVRPPDPDFRAAIVNLSSYRAVLSTRFHAIVTALEMNIPCVAAVLDDYYEAKMRGAARFARSPLSLINPLRDPPRAVAEWVAAKRDLNSVT